MAALQRQRLLKARLARHLPAYHSRPHPLLTPPTPRRAGELYGSGNILLKARNLVKGLQGVDNVYTQHSPLITTTLGGLRDGGLSTQDYPYMGSTVRTRAVLIPTDFTPWLWHRRYSCMHRRNCTA